MYSGTYGFVYQTEKPLTDSEIYQAAVAIEEAEATHPCSFCEAEGLTPPADGSKGIGGFKDYPEDEPTLFNGHICDMHKDSIDWIEFRWIV